MWEQRSMEEGLVFVDLVEFSAAWLRAMLPFSDDVERSDDDLAQGVGSLSWPIP